MPAETCAPPPIPGIAGDQSEPRFFAPWQARLFALTLAAYENGLFSWPDWSARFSKILREMPALPEPSSDEDHADQYFLAWMRSFEDLIHDIGAATPDTIRETADIWKNAALATPHGQPILFENGQKPQSDAGR